MPTDMKFLSLVSNDLLTKSEAKERSRAKLLAVNMTIVNQGKAVSCKYDNDDCQSSYHRKVGLSGIFAQIKKEPTSDIMKCECQDCHHTFSTASKKYLFCFCSSAVISSGPLASSKIQAYSEETVDKRYRRFFSEECRVCDRST
ncbi:uncharacterized protein [Solanum tuberosum]|uniref:uncharacterized protein isoform X2 n=1 Tax=Solanum tuberosum TaxID=4113 RepID=UPI00073A0C30|nr:PREDICTED: uncharacterized protein LOC102579395 isoform X2 [Solanum tuberosum]